MSCSDLKPCRTSEEAKKRGRNGGLASGEARRKRKALRELVAIALEQPYKDYLEHTNGNSNAEEMAARLAKKAAQGDISAIKLILQLEGETSKQDDEAEPVNA